MLTKQCLVTFGLLFAGVAPAWADDFFDKKVAPLLQARCFECHSHEKKIKGGLALDSKSGWEKGGKSGPAIVPGKPEVSLLIKALSHAEVDLKMPPKQMLPNGEVEIFKEWIKKGAVDPRVLAKTSAKPELATEDDWEKEFTKRLDWWSLRPMRVGAPPGDDPAYPAWAQEPVDRFLLAKLKQKNLKPARPADSLTLLRRLSFILTGLPPTPADVRAFEKARGETAYEQLVDRLLASPHFGERFARHWMDVIRYTDTYGYEWDNPAKGSFEYRDYLIRGFNDDLGFDRLLQEQLAGDLLPPRIHPATQTLETLIAPMFYHLGEHRHGSSLMFNGTHQDMVNNKIDAFSKAFLATSVACARCHNHKLEAVPQRDYYALAAVFTTPRWTSRVADAPGKNDAAIARLKELRGDIQTELALLWRNTRLNSATLRQALGDPAKSKPTIQEVAYPLMRLTQKESVKNWEVLKKEWQTAREMRKKANQAFNPLGQVQQGVLPPGWVVEGDGMIHGHVREGTPLVALTGEKIIDRLLEAGFHTQALSSKLPGVLRMPAQHLVAGKFASLNLAGGEFGGYLVMDDHAFQNETISFLKNTEAQWKSFADAALINGAQQVTVEFATASLNPNFPPRTGLAPGLNHNDFGYEKRSWISVTGIVAHDSGGAPQDELAAFASLYERESPKDEEAVSAAMADWLASPLGRWSKGKTQPGDRDILNWLLEKNLLLNQAPLGSKLASLVKEYRSVENGIAFARTVNSMDERETPPMSYPLNVRGNPDVSGPLIPPGSLSMLEVKQRTGQGAGLSRLELANSLLDPEHPLTARVYVNRVWHWVFGAGLVATPDDFGRLGDRPSHPELLDWLARQSIQEGWSTKKLVRRLVLSQAFRQSGEVSAAARESDPGNRLLHHFATRRLEAEAIRDTLLAVSGRLDGQLYGRPVFPPRAVEDSPKRLFSGPLDGDGRRSIYLQMSIMDPPKFLVGFNLPDLRLPTGRRDVTQVPSQALTLLNDPFVNEMARYWASRLVKERHDNPNIRIRAMFLHALGRDPNPRELHFWNMALMDFSPRRGSALMDEEAAWQNLAHALFNTKELIHFR
ncbi:MAG: DUF1553 domain-containing protein [Gemmataceae bacterium]|nr:DUF1553 domain-containing protein [Gemmataceae bacterium]